MRTKHKLLFYCQHSVGIGHLARSFALIDALKKVFEVTLVSGGLFPKGIPMPSEIDFVQLPPIGQNGAGKLEVIESAEPLHLVMSERKKLLFKTYKQIDPHIVVTEFFPFGKIQFMGELLPMLKHIKTTDKAVMLVASLRDILEVKSTSQQLQQRFSSSVANEYYDEILVHGDPKIITLDATCPQLSSIDVPVSYSGYVTNARSIGSVNFKDNKVVIVSLGAGKVGNPFAQKVVDAYENYGFGDGILLQIIAGPLFPEKEYNALLNRCELISGVSVQKHVGSLVEVWKNARLSVSMAGYNTTMELIKNRVPAVLLPYENQTNTEQVIRATKMKDAGLVLTLDFNEASSEDIADIIKRGLSFTPNEIIINMDGAESTAKLLRDKYINYAFT